MKIKAFTLIELLIVVAIIGILAAIAIPNFRNAQIRAKVSRSVANEKSLYDAMMMYALDNNAIPKHEDTPWQHNRFTTPIAYVNSPVRDIFQENNHTQAGKDTIFYWNGLHHNEPWGLLGGYLSNQRGSYWLEESKKNAFLIRGVGPDLHQSDVNYEPSNGVSSEGDINKLFPKFGKFEGI